MFPTKFTAVFFFPVNYIPLKVYDTNCIPVVKQLPFHVTPTLATDQNVLTQVCVILKYTAGTGTRSEPDPTRRCTKRLCLPTTTITFVSSLIHVTCIQRV